MAETSYHQSAFIGGAWGPLSYGRSDLPNYQYALKVCVNGIIVEEGAWARRSGFQFIMPTYGRNAAKLLPFYANFAAAQAGFPSSGVTLNVAIEFTPSVMRFVYLTSPVFTLNQPTVTSSSMSAGVLTLGVSTVANLSVNDNIMVVSSSIDAALIGPFRNRVMRITAIPTGTSLTVKDDVGNAMTGVTSSSNDLVGATVYQILKIATPYTANYIQSLRVVQSSNTQAIVLAEANAPYTLTIDDTVVSFDQTTFTDGPYLDQQGTFADPERGTASAATGTITFIPNDTTFDANDIGRAIRLFSEPPLWTVINTYVDGNTVSYPSGEWWVLRSSSSVTGVRPGTPATIGGVPTTVWFPAPNEGQWAWGTITAQATTSCTIVLETDLNAGNGLTISVFRLGVYKIGEYPTCGLYHEGRLYLGGAIANRFDASSTDGAFIFSPTDLHGFVLDSSAISRTLDTDKTDPIYWFAPDHQGIIAGTMHGEWLIQASVLNDPITPTSIQAHQITEYGCANIEPRRCGMALVYVQTYGRMVMEYLADAFSGKFSAKHLNEQAKHFANTGILEIAYQRETAPVIWCRGGDGSLFGTTYRRVSRFVVEDPKINAWHKQVLGGNYDNLLSRPLTSMCVLPANDGLSDLLYVANTDVNGANGWIEVLRPLYEDG